MKKLAIIVVILISASGQLLAQYAEDMVKEARLAIKADNTSLADSLYTAAMKSVDEDDYKDIRAEWDILNQISVLLSDARRSMDRADDDDALVKFDEAIKLMDKSPYDIWGKFKGQAIYNKGMIYYHQEKPIKAADAFREAMKFNPEEEKYGKAIEMVRNKHYSEGHKYFKRKDYMSAQAEYEKAVAVDPSFSSGYYQLAIIAKRDGFLTKAENYYRDAVTSDPTHYKSWYGLGTLYTETGNNAKAIESLKMSISINPRYDRAYYMLGKVYESQNNTTLAIQALKKAIDSNNKYTKAYELLGQIYVSQEKFTDTISLLKDLTGRTTSEETYLYLARAYNGLTNYSAALTAATRSLNKRKNWAPALIEKGDALKGLNRNKDAVMAYREAATDARWKSVAEYRINELTKWEGK